MTEIQCGTVSIVGAKFHNMSQRMVNELYAKEVRLIREPNNEHDSNAIGCWANVSYSDGYDEHLIGYIPRTHSQNLAPLMDNGINFKAIVCETAPGLKILAKLMWMKED